MPNGVQFFPEELLIAKLCHPSHHEYWVTVSGELAAFGCAVCNKGPVSRLAAQLEGIPLYGGVSSQEVFNRYLDSVQETLGAEEEWEDASVSLVLVDRERGCGFIIGKGGLWSLESRISLASPDQSLAAAREREGAAIDPDELHNLSRIVTSGLNRSGRMGGDYFDLGTGPIAVTMSIPMPTLHTSQILGAGARNMEDILSALLSCVSRVDRSGLVAVWM